jgi:hypothetical protein
MAKRQRDYGAEYRARVARLKDPLIAAGVDPKTASSIARGHAPAGAPTAREIRAAEKRTGAGVGEAYRRASADARARETLVGGAKLAKTSSAFTYPGGTVLDTNSPRDFLRALRRAAARGDRVVVIGTRSDGKGAPVANGRETRAADIIDALEDLLGEDLDAGNVFEGIGDLYGPGGVPAAVVRVHIEVVGR